MMTRKRSSALLGVAGLAAILSFSASTALGQLPEPRVADVNERNGMISRFLPLSSTLPRDPYRDVFYDTRWADYPQVTHPNWFKHNGLYGLRWAGSCTSCTYPYFRGSPGTSTITPRCRPMRPVFRFVENVSHPFRPVGSYYAGGCYVPLYDLDPLVVGPGPNPWPFYFNWCKGG
jgi:hypothetical protein